MTDPTGEMDLTRLIKTMTATLQDGTYAFVTLPERSWPDGLRPRLIFEETEGTTLIVLKSDAEMFRLPHTFPCRMITLEVHSALEAVGFIAQIATELAKAGMGVNPVSGYFHDHLFVPIGREQDAMDILDRLSQSA